MSTALLSVIPMISNALSVVAAFNGNANVAKATGYVQDAIGVVNALTPLVTQFGRGEEVTEDDVRAALAGKDAALEDFDRLIGARA